MDAGPTRYDDADRHHEAVLEAGQPPEQAFAHIGVLLGWLIRMDLHDPDWLAPELVESIRDGSLVGSDLATACERPRRG